MASRLRQIRHGWPQKIETRERESGLHTQGDARGQKGGESEERGLIYMTKVANPCHRGLFLTHKREQTANASSPPLLPTNNLRSRRHRCCFLRAWRWLCLAGFGSAEGRLETRRAREHRMVQRWRRQCNQQRSPQASLSLSACAAGSNIFSLCPRCRRGVRSRHCTYVCRVCV